MTVVNAFRATFVVVTLAGSCAAHAEGHHWSYGKHGGPAEWGELDQAFASCQLGKLQSPIDIRGAKAADLPRDQVRLQARAAEADRQRPHDPGELRAGQLDRRRRNALRAGPVPLPQAERREDRRQGARDGRPSRAQGRRRQARGRRGAARQGRRQPDAATRSGRTCRRRRKRKSPRRRTIDAATLLPADKGYYTFQGSLTTPPCSEGVRWFVLKTPMKIAASELTAFAKLYPMNARPTQPLNGRAVEATR